MIQVEQNLPDPITDAHLIQNPSNENEVISLCGWGNDPKGLFKYNINSKQFDTKSFDTWKIVIPSDYQSKVRLTEDPSVYKLYKW